jgi:hypothetical protein
MQIQLTDRYLLEEKIRFLNQDFSRQEALKVIYNWVKSGYISCGAFSVMIDKLRDDDHEEEEV